MVFKVSKSFIILLYHKKSKAFLWKLYSLSAERKDKKKRDALIACASNSECKVLLTILHLIVVKVIPVRTSQIVRIKLSRKFALIAKTLFADEDHNVILEASEDEQKSFLQKINCYHQLLFNLFNEED